MKPREPQRGSIRQWRATNTVLTKEYAVPAVSRSNISVNEGRGHQCHGHAAGAMKAHLITVCLLLGMQ